MSYSMVIIRVIKKNETGPRLSSLVGEHTCQQITHLTVISATVHVWAGLSRGIKKREQGASNLWTLSPVFMSVSVLEVTRQIGAVTGMTSGYLPISQKVRKSKCTNCKGQAYA